MYVSGVVKAVGFLKQHSVSLYLLLMVKNFLWQLWNWFFLLCFDNTWGTSMVNYSVRFWIAGDWKQDCIMIWLTPERSMHLHMMTIYTCYLEVFSLTFHSQDLPINLPYCLLYISHYFSSENFVSNQTIFICWYFFSILVTVLFENIWTLLGETTACLLSKQTVNYQWRIQRDLNNFLQIKVAVIT